MNKPVIGIIGLGIMGNGIALNFLKNGYEVNVWNRTTQKLALLAEKGATIHDSIASCVSASDIVFEVTANDESARAVWYGEHGIITAATAEKIFITAATLSEVFIDELSESMNSKGFTFFDMPMTGGRVAAETGNLTLLVGGDEAKLEDLRSTLSAIAGDVKCFGKNGTGMRYKLILNGLQALHVVGMGQALAAAKANGLDVEMVGNALCERPGGALTAVAWQGYKEQPDPVTFSVEWITKDLTYLQQMHPSTLTAELIASYKKLIDAGEADKDWTEITRFVS
ncbi:MAG: NAD(P)-dependent oxidoreductase [Candidatus Saccharimonadales bacterium]